MHKKVLVCLPLNDAHRAALEASVPEFEFRFNALTTSTPKMCSGPTSAGQRTSVVISQNKHIEWFQSNSAGPDAYLNPASCPKTAW